MLFQDGSLFEQVLILQLLAAHVNSLIVTTIDSVLSNCPFYISLASSKPQTKVKSFKYRIPALKAEPLVYQFPLILSISSRLYGNGHRKNWYVQKQLGYREHLALRLNMQINPN
ncbi:Hypothetical protein PP7435_CHR2-2639 [Komagataella phaffii CBS 7435]|uniref:Uncharacterized protein n=2 Tax=Komagataella phaffii TaxID=460519 RepID=C4QZM6_KOMPG|nr:Hypothetical protein PAS_chr2-1_0098 [Komagataella phaffii GS115]AOA62819.1 GQ67_00123T0 [Komagataella phaffii]CAH2448803.1 Hypothetical protein BQ9382_C2-6510 [Komagataella phaffii CBS 7435]AOA67630.1 GQ68_01265T0 [Komagataella phaffii GS115]CAY68700.1 Hypothetical protein PAS_chr2-1_0098 [Komagataella phaffii GS115]SCV12119.1 Hypothetical protein PP7435_CHR2-2639 [Komagataella phaffii CBS 7435]